MKLYKKVHEIRQNGGKYDAGQSWHSQNKKLAYKYQIFDPANTSEIQFQVY